MFTHLHNHTHYSLMDGLNTPLEMAQCAKDLGQTAISITDHGTLSGHRDMQKACREVGIKPVLGVEAYISPTDRFDRRKVSKRDDHTQNYHHIILLAKNNNGLENIKHMSNIAWTEGFYSKPRIDMELLEEYGDDVVVLSGCMNGLIAKAHERGDYEYAMTIMKRFVNRFEDDFYMEIQPHNPPELNEYLHTLGQGFGIRSVTTSDCHFTRPEFRAVEEALLILSTNPKFDKDKSYEAVKHLDIWDKYNTLYPERPISFEDIDVFMHSYNELMDLSEVQKYPESLEATQEIVEKVGDYEFIENRNFLPVQVKDPDATLESKALAGLVKRGLLEYPEDGYIPQTPYTERLYSELDIIKKKEFAPYFLIVEDMIRWAKTQGIRVGPGRGSGAGSLVNYALGITDVDPLKYDLLFSRFIDESRADWPDIDVDFQRSRRGEVKEYLAGKYGHVASISNFIYFSDKQVIRDVAKVFRIPLSEVNKALKSVDKYEQFETSRTTEKFRNKYPEVLEYADILRGRIRSVGLHAAGVVASSEPLENYAPIETRSDPSNKVSGRLSVVGWDMRECEEVGLIKLDILGLTQLDMIDDAIKIIKSRGGDVSKMNDLDDPAVYNMLTEGWTKGVFQCDAGPYRKLLMDMKVDKFDDLVASNALVRPGAMNTVGQIFVNRKNGFSPVNYAHPILQEITHYTYGVIIYQEQVMQACVRLGGLTEAEANKVRKIIGKKRDVQEFDQYKEKFIEGASEHVGRQVASDLWHDFEAHAGYSFNLSHAVAYSMVSYQTAWLKHYYPLEYMLAVFRNEENKDNKTTALIEMRRLGIKLKTPHVNKSDANAKIEGDAIRLGLTDIKYISDKMFAALDQFRPIRNYEHLLEISAMGGNSVNSRTVQSLNKVGAASFKDNPLRGDERDYFYEYMGIPVFGKLDIPAFGQAVITPCAEGDDAGAFIYRGVVKRTKKGSGWTLIEIIDESGERGFFDVEDSEIASGQMYVFLVGDNSVMEAVPLDNLADQSIPFVRYLHGGCYDIPEDKQVVLGVSQRKTKAGKLMGNIVVADNSSDLEACVVFPKQYAKFYGKLKPGILKRFNMMRTREGSMMLTGVV